MDNAKPPVIPSQLSASKAAELWTKLHDQVAMEDADGLQWSLIKDSWQSSSLEAPKNLVWNLKLQLRVAVTAADLIQDRTLDPMKDSRMVDLIGKSQILMELKPFFVAGYEEDEVDRRAAFYAFDLREKLRQKSLREVKRNLVAQWLERTLAFRGYTNYVK